MTELRAHRLLRIGTLNCFDNASAWRAGLLGLDLLLGQEVPPGATSGPAVEAGHGTDLAIAWNPSALRPIDHELNGFHLAHEGRAKVTPRRGTLVACFVSRDTAVRLAVMDGHRINRTARRWLAVPGIYARWRRAQLRKHKALDESLARDLRAAGFVVIAGGDYNELRPGPPVPGARRLFTGRTIDHVWTTAGRAVAAVRQGTTRINGTDHALRWVTCRLRPKPSPQDPGATVREPATGRASTGDAS